MVKRNSIIGLLLSLLLVTPSIAQSGKQDSGRRETLPSATGKERKLPYTNMALTAELTGIAVSDSNWYNWCVSPISGKDGKIHIFGSRWPESDGMEGWSGKNAEIAHFVADRPEGPFRYIQTVMTSDMFPDQTRMSAPHNPRIEYVDGKYILLYICQDPSAKMKMRTGMMIADNLEGPWRFAGKDGILVEPSVDPKHWTYQAAVGTPNPAFLKIKGKYYIYFGSGTPEQMKTKYGYAVSDNLEGPYTLCDTPATDNISYIEDAQAFSYNNKHYLLTTDNLGGNTGIYGNLILWESDNGLAFKLSNAKIAMGTIFDYWGTEEEQKALTKSKNVFVRSNSGKLERPAVLFQNGKPTYLYAVGGININGGKVSESYIFKIHWNE